MFRTCKTWSHKALEILMKKTLLYHVENVNEKRYHGYCQNYLILIKTKWWLVTCKEHVKTLSCKKETLIPACVNFQKWLGKFNEIKMLRHNAIRESRETFQQCDCPQNSYRRKYSRCHNIQGPNPRRKSIFIR